MKNNRIITGIQPTGNMHIGNYFGAIAPIMQSISLANSLQDSMQDSMQEILFFVADLHAITIPQNINTLASDTLNIAALYMACGIDNMHGFDANNNKTQIILFKQSDIPQHANLSWILSCVTKLGWVNRATQFKDKSDKLSANLGLYAYPALMSADILLYDAQRVSVGKDQLQHLEITREIAEAFNHRYQTNCLVKPFALQNETIRIMSLRDPTKKMSKSDSDNLSRISMLDSEDIVRQKINKAVTDSLPMPVDLEELQERQTIYNLITLYNLFTLQTLELTIKQYAGKNISHFKKELINVCNQFLKPIQNKFHVLQRNPQLIMQSLENGRQHALLLAEKKYKEIAQIVGIISQ